MTNRKQEIGILINDIHSLKQLLIFQPTKDLKDSKISPSQWKVLVMIEKHNNVGIKEISEMFDITSSAATQLVEGLVKKGYVTRVENLEDRRKVSLLISREAKDCLDRKRKEYIEQFMELFKIFSDEEFEQYLSLNKKLVEKFKQDKKI